MEFIKGEGDKPKLPHMILVTLIETLQKECATYIKNTNISETKIRRRLNELMGSTGLLRSNRTVTSVKRQISSTKGRDALIRLIQNWITSPNISFPQEWNYQDVDHL